MISFLTTRPHFPAGSRPARSGPALPRPPRPSPPRGSDGAAAGQAGEVNEVRARKVTFALPSPASPLAGQNRASASFSFPEGPISRGVPSMTRSSRSNPVTDPPPDTHLSRQPPPFPRPPHPRGTGNPGRFGARHPTFCCGAPVLPPEPQAHPPHRTPTHLVHRPTIAEDVTSATTRALVLQLLDEVRALRADLATIKSNPDTTAPDPTATSVGHSPHLLDRHRQSPRRLHHHTAPPSARPLRRHAAMVPDQAGRRALVRDPHHPLGSGRPSIGARALQPSGHHRLASRGPQAHPGSRMTLPPATSSPQSIAGSASTASRIASNRSASPA